MADGTLEFNLVVLGDTGSIGDLNGLFFDLADGALVSGLEVTGTDITGSVFNEDSVTKVDGYNNINGEVAKDYGKFDVGVQFGTSGIGEDDIRETSFILSHESVDLTLDMFLSMDFAVRLTSVGEEDGSRDGSLKIGGTAPDEVDGESGPIFVANDDTMTVSNIETFSDFGLSDPLDDFVFTILENDQQDGAVYSGDVVSANGQAFDDFVIVQGSAGGLMKFNADGTVDFSANNEFDFLADDQTATTQFTYGIAGGAEATVTVEVFAFDDNGGGGGFEPF